MTAKISRFGVFILLGFFSVLLVSRFYNLDKTARFIWDESSDLVHMQQIYKDRNLTLIGPISEDGSKVFGSLSYYMLLPFAILWNFDPLSTALGAAFWGVLTIILIGYLTYLLNKKILLLTIPLYILWFPLVETGRWAWNPNLIPFWIALALIVYLKKIRYSNFITGLFMGLAIHLHYVSVFATSAFGLVILVDSIRKKGLNNFFAYSAGAIAAIFPFIAFDLTHPPGLFLSRILYFNNLSDLSGGGNFFVKFIQVFDETFYYFTQSLLSKNLLIVTFLTLAIVDVRKRSESLKHLAVFGLQLIGVSLIASFFPHYILPALIFFIAYLIFPRKGKGKMLSLMALLIILISSIFSFPVQIEKVTWETNIASTRYIAKTIQNQIETSDMKNVNVAVLASDDPNTYGRRYRDLLLLNDIQLKTKGEYEISDSLFVITTSSLDIVRNDPAYEIKTFKDGPLIKEWGVPGSPWKIFLLSKPT